MNDQVFIIHSLPGAGKTRNSVMLAGWLQCGHIIEEVDGSALHKMSWISKGKGNWLLLALTGGVVVTSKGKIRDKFQEILDQQGMQAHSYDLLPLLIIAEATGQEIVRNPSTTFRK